MIGLYVHLDPEKLKAEPITLENFATVAFSVECCYQCYYDTAGTICVVWVIWWNDSLITSMHVLSKVN